MNNNIKQIIRKKKSIKTPIKTPIKSPIKSPIKTPIEQIQQIMSEAINMDEYIHSTCKFNNMVIKNWLFKKDDECYTLSYKYGVIPLYKGNFKIDEWKLKNNNTLYTFKINNINDKIKEILVNLDDFKKNYIEMNNVIDIIKLSPLKEVTFKINDVIGWNIKNECKITIDIFDINKTLVTFKNEDPKIYNKKQLLAFVKSKSEILKKILEKILNEKILNEKILNEKILNENELNENELNELLKNVSMYIKKPLKERYESQSCKKFKKEEWD